MFSAFRYSKIKILLITIAVFFVSISLFPQASEKEGDFASAEVSNPINETSNAKNTNEEAKITSPLTQKSKEVITTIDASNSKIRIEKVDYKIVELTRKFPLQLAVPIDTKIVFENEASFLNYLDSLKQEFTNMRTLETASIEYDYIEVQEDIVLAHITINTKDTWNIIALPFPKYDSNSGLVLKLKGKDYNFLGSLQVLNIDVAYVLENDGKSSGNIGLNFSYPFRAGPLNATYKLDSTLDITKDSVGFDLNNTLQFAYPTRFVDIYFGFYQGFNLNKPRDEKKDIEKKIKDKQNNNEDDLALEKKTVTDSYFFYTKFFLYTPITIYTFANSSSLVYTPYVAFSGNWAFKQLAKRENRGITGTFSHSLGISKIDWAGNFRRGYSFNIDNSYSYNFFLKDKPSIEVSGTLTGFYSFFERFGIYSQLDIMYSTTSSKRAGRNLRGILNRRAETDMAITLNVDVPIKIASFDWQKITGVDWSRYFGFEWFVSFFLDMALIHDTKTERYLNPKDGWYSGGFEFILYPHKMRSIYFRVSLGFDLCELQNVKGLNKIGGKAKRDGDVISEIFIGIGHHY